jgi:hypothetical protein
MLEDAPQLPILDRYTLYTVEGASGDEYWYALRAGFFSDAASAQQLADHVCSEFASVAVVRISTQEMRTATGEDWEAEFGPTPARPMAEPQAGRSRSAQQAPVRRAAPERKASPVPARPVQQPAPTGKPLSRILGRLGDLFKR